MEGAGSSSADVKPHLTDEMRSMFRMCHKVRGTLGLKHFYKDKFNIKVTNALFNLVRGGKKRI